MAKVSPGKDIYLLTVFQFAFAGLFAWMGGLLTETFPAQALTRPEVLLPLAYLGVMATTVALLFQNVGQVWSDGWRRTPRTAGSARPRRSPSDPR